MANQKKSYYPNHPARQHDFNNFARKFLIVLIPCIAIILAIAIACTFIFNPERQAKSELEALARNYYENIIYQNMLNSDNFSGDPAKTLEEYTDKGLSLVKLRQLILLNEDSNINTSHVLEYCDKEQTLVKYYPEPPFEKTSYRIEFDYSCNF